jgi:hypothetical protein
MVRFSALRTGRTLTPGRFLVFISVRDWVVSRDIVRLEWLGKLENLASYQMQTEGCFPVRPPVTSIWCRVMEVYLHFHKPVLFWFIRHAYFLSYIKTKMESSTAQLHTHTRARARARTHARARTATSSTRVNKLFDCDSREGPPLNLAVRVPGYRSRGPGSIPGATRFSEK